MKMADGEISAPREHHHCLPTKGGKPLHWGHGSSLLEVWESGLIRKTFPVLALGELSL